MTLRIKLTLFMLAVSLIPILTYAGISYKIVRDNALQIAVSTGAERFEENMNIYEQKIERLNNTALDIISNRSLYLLYRPIMEKVSFSDYTAYQRWQIVSNYSIMERCVDAHFAAQRDLLDGIGLVVNARNYATVVAGNFTFSSEAIRESSGNLGFPVQHVSYVDGKPILNIALTFSSLIPHEALGSCVLNIDIESLFESLRPSEFMVGERIFVLDKDDIILFHSDRDLIGTKYEETGLQNGEISTDMTSYLAKSENETFIVTCQRMKSNPDWKVYYARPHASFVKSSVQMANILLPFALLCAVIAIFAALVFAQIVYRPVRRLTQSLSHMDGRSLQPLAVQNLPSEFELLASSFNRLLQDINDLLHEVEREAQNAKNAEIIALRAQVSPHFLYNTLNVVKVLAAQGKTDEVQIAVTGLISLLRVSIGDTRDIVPFKQELEYVENYIILQRYRLDLMFSYDTCVEDEAAHLSVPRFILQPIVENALIHGFHDIARDDSAIFVHARVKDSVLIISVTDNGAGITEDERRTLNGQFEETTRIWMNKVGLHNVLGRARHLFGDTVKLSIENTGQGTCISLELPAVPYADGNSP